MYVCIWATTETFALCIFATTFRIHKEVNKINMKRKMALLRTLKSFLSSPSTPGWKSSTFIFPQTHPTLPWSCQRHLQLFSLLCGPIRRPPLSLPQSPIPSTSLNSRPTHSTKTETHDCSFFLKNHQNRPTVQTLEP